MKHEGKSIGVIGAWRAEVKPFYSAQIELLETFAAQAVIAIENVRLFNETKESLDHQKASAEILRGISGAIEDPGPGFAALVATCERLFEWHAVGINVREPERKGVL